MIYSSTMTSNKSINKSSLNEFAPKTLRKNLSNKSLQILMKTKMSPSLSTSSFKSSSERKKSNKGCLTSEISKMIKSLIILRENCDKILAWNTGCTRHRLPLKSNSMMIEYEDSKWLSLRSIQIASWLLQYLTNDSQRSNSLNWNHC